MKLWPNLTAWLRSVTRTAPRDGARDLTTERTWSLRFRLLLSVTIALTPIAVVSVLQGLERARADVATVHQSLLQSARMAASSEENMFSAAEQILRAVGNISQVRDMAPGCSLALGDALIGVHFFTNISRINAHGVVVCSGLPGAMGRDASGLAVFRQARDSGKFSVSGVMTSDVTREPMIAAMLPLKDKAGKFAGAVAIALDTRWLDFLLRERALPKGAVVSIFDRQGRILASNNNGIAGAIFAHVPAAHAPDALFTAVDTAGNNWTYATAPLLGHSVFVGFAMEEARLFGSTYLHVGTDFLMPIVMIGLAWAGIWVATERQVTQWIVYLRRISAAYRRGHYAVRPALEDAPSEFRLLGGALSEMASGIQDRDTRLREAVAQKSLLIKEIHHRVKNNLQIVMSLLSLQSAQLRDAAGREALTQAQTRINALALVHRILHEIEDQSTVDLRRLLQELTNQVVEGMRSEETEVDLTLDIVPRDVSGDLAVPIALFTVEALTNIFKHAFGPGDRDCAIAVSLKPVAGGKLMLAIRDNGRGYAAREDNRSVGSRLIRTFGLQIGGETSIRSRAGQGTSVELVFPDPDIRHAALPLRVAAEG